MSETPPSSPFTPDEARDLLRMLLERFPPTGKRIPPPHVRRVMAKLEKLSKQ